MNEFQVNTNGNKAEIKLNCALTVNVAKELHSQIAAAVNSGVNEITFDLSLANIVDSSGIGLLVATHNSVKKNNGKVKVTGLSQEIDKLFKAMHLDRHIELEKK